MERAVIIRWFLCQWEVEGGKKSSHVDPGESGHCSIKGFWMCWMCSLSLQFFMPSIPTASNANQRDRRVQLCVCGATTERKAPWNISCLGIPQENLQRSSHLCAPGCVCMHRASKPWAGVSMSSALSRQPGWGRKCLCVSWARSRLSSSTLLIFRSLLIFRYSFHLVGGRVLINGPVRVFFFYLGIFRTYLFVPTILMHSWL